MCHKKDNSTDQFIFFRRILHKKHQYSEGSLITYYFYSIQLCRLQLGFIRNIKQTSSYMLERKMLNAMIFLYFMKLNITICVSNICLETYIFIIIYVIIHEGEKGGDLNQSYDKNH